MAKSRPGLLTALQRQLMQVVWERGEVTVTEVRDALAARKRDLARNTVQTMMVRLEEKGWLKHREESRRFIYSANRPQKSSVGAKVVQMVDQLFSGSAEELVTALIEYRGLTPEEAARIREMIDRQESQKPKNKKRGQ